MENLNRIELRGTVGSVKTHNVGDAKVARFAMATCFTFSNRQGESVVEVTWHNVSAWQSESVSFEGLAQGAQVHVIGRIRTQRYTASDGSERTFYEVVAGKLDVL
jgi:single-strand DNA-binding protein